MEYICHRINTIRELKELKQDMGVELDLRDNLNGELYMEHNPFMPGENFQAYLDSYCHRTMILNIKSEGIEPVVRKLLKEKNITNYFFLDSSFPMIKKMADLGERKIALRFSEYEGMDTLKKMAGLVEWVWADCFHKIPLDYKKYKEIRKMGYRICLVSPELQGHQGQVEQYAEFLIKENIILDAVCTKSYCVDMWKRRYEELMDGTEEWKRMDY